MSTSTLAARLQFLGGNQNNRITKQKLRSLQWAMKNDYQTRMIKTPYRTVWPALINFDQAGLKSDYDKKYVSVEYESGLEPGDVFECLDDGTHWMIYLPILTEKAYLHSQIIRCRYTLTIDDVEYWIYFQGPTETDLRWFQKRGINVNELNLSGTIYIKLNPQTRKFFERFTHIKVDNHVWEVQVTDSISVPGILELEVQEYYDNPIAELPEITHKDSDIIIGETTVKQDTIVGYYINKEYFKNNLEWSVEGNDRVAIIEVLDNGYMCKVRVYDGAVGSYTVRYGTQSIECTIDWQEPYIKGPQEIYPFDFFEYRGAGTYSVESDLVRIVQQTAKGCKIEVLTGKTGNFILYCEKENGEIEQLPVKIRSWFGGKDEGSVGIVS